VTTAVRFDETCSVSGGADTDALQGRVILGPKQLVIATEESRIVIPVRDIFDVVDVRESPAEVRVGYETDGVKRAQGCVFDRRAAVDRFVHALFRATLSGTRVRIRTEDGVRKARFVVGRNRCLIRSGETMWTIEHVRKLRLAGKGDWIKIACGGGSTVDRLGLAFDAPKCRNLAGRYLSRLQTGSADAPLKPGGEDEIRVLLVDDDDGFTEVASIFLSRANSDIVVEVARDVERGLERLSRTPSIDCVVSDYRMPEADGLSFLKSVRKVSDELPFLLFTGAGDEEVAAGAVNNDATGYLRKSTDTSQFATLAERIETAVRTGRIQSA
jgi:CheY-like chemotaxis protein